MSNNIKLYLLALVSSATLFAQGHSGAVLSMGGTNNVNGYFTNQTTYLSFSFTTDDLDTDDSGSNPDVTDIELRAVVKADGANPSAANIASGNYETRLQIYWETENGCDSGNAVNFSCNSIGIGETFTFKVYQSAIEGLTGFDNGKRIFFALYYKGTANTIDVADFSGSGIKSGTNGFYLDIDTEAPTLSNIKEKDTDESYTNNGFFKDWKFKYTVGGEAISSGTLTYTKVSGDGNTVNVTSGTNGADTFDNGETASTNHVYGDNSVGGDPSLVTNTYYNISIMVRDARNNERTYSYSNMKYDTTVPTVSHLTSTDGTYTENDVVPITVHFSEEVTKTGTPALALETGASDASVNFTSGNNSNQFLFNYTVADNHINLDLDVSDRSSLSGTIKDYAGNQYVASNGLPADGSNNQLDERNDVIVDGDAPASLVLTSVTPTGGTVTAGKWNLTNTGVAIVVPLTTDDNSLDDGKVTIVATESNANSFEDVIVDQVITAGERGAGSKTINLSKDQMTGITNYADSKTIWFTSKTYDKAGNMTQGPTTYKLLVIDIAAPFVEQVQGTSGTYRLGETITLTLDFSEAITLAGGDPTLTLNTTETHWSFTGSADAVATETAVSDDDMTLTFDVTTSHVSGDLNHKSTTALTLPTGVTIVDANGNNATLTLPALDANTNGPPVSKALAEVFNIIIDGKAPTAQEVADVTTEGGDSVAVGYLNAGNDKIYVKVPLGPGGDGSLASGQVILLAEVGSAPEDDDTVPGYAIQTIASSDVTRGFDLPMVTEAELDDIAGFTDGAEIYFNAITKDAASTANVRNSTTNTVSSSTLKVDQAVPLTAAIAADKLTTTGGVVVDAYWNASNTGISAEVTLPKLANGNEDTSLDGGHAQLEKNINNGGWVRMGTPVEITQAERLAAKKTLTNTAAHLEKAGLTEGHTIKFRAVVWDIAGNRVDGATYGTTYTVDQVVPTVDEVTSAQTEGNPKLKVDETLDIQVTFTEVVNITGTPKLLLDTDESPGSVLSEALYNSDTGSTSPKFRLTVATNNYNRDLNYRSTASLELDGGTIRDEAGNNATLTLPALDNAKALKQMKDYWVDGVLPTIQRVEDVITTGDTIVAGHWNSTNTGLKVKVPLETADISLAGGTVQLQGRAVGDGADGAWDNFGPSTTIDNDAHLSKGFIEMTPNKAQFTGLNRFTDGDVVSVRAVVTDFNGNASTFTASNTQIIVDLTYPSTPATYKPSKVRSAIDFGGADDGTYGIYWNQTHNGVNITIPFTNDASLAGGYLQFQARSTTGGTWVPIGFRKIITPAQVAAAADLTYSFDTVTSIEDRTQPDGTTNVGGDNEQEFGIDKIDGFGNDKVLYFRVMVADAAGNSIFSDASTSTLYVEERSPTINEVTSSSDNKAYKVADKINLQVVSTAVYAADPNMTITGIPQLNLETGDIADAVVNYTSGSGSKTLLFEYTVATGHTSPDLNYFDVNSLTLNGGTIKDPYGNNVTLTLPTLDNANALKQKKDIEIDTTPPSVTFTYDDPDSLVRFEDGQMVITATFSDSIEFNTVPILTVDFPNNTAGDKTNVNMTSTTGKIFTYNLPLVDNSDGQIAVSITAKDKALNPLIADSVFADSIITIDNTDPIAFPTGLMTMFGDTVSGSWFNKSTDSIKVIVPIDIEDESLLRGNIQIQMQVDGKMTSDSWATILPKDSLEVLAASISKYRTKKEVLDILTPQKLAQGDSVFVRAIINDQVGNTTIGATSSSFFILDTIPPAVPTGQKALITLTDRPDTTISNLDGETIFLTSLRNGNNNDTLWTNDSLVFATQNWKDPKLEAEVLASGIQRYEYSLFESTTADSASAFTTLRAYKFQTNLLDTVIVAIDSLTHDRWYYPRLRAVDVAGNISDPISYYKTFRHNARPIVDTIPRVIAYEDVLWEKVLEINDKDVATLRSDKFFYKLESFISDTTQTPWAIIEPKINTINAAVSAAGNVSFTPTKLDTAAYIHRVIITDNWGLKDTLDFEMRVNPVNDPPVLDLSAISKLIFNEGTSSDSINLTRYVTDEDNLVSSLKYSFKIASKLPANIGYPTAKIGFLSNFNSKYKNKLITDLVDEYPSSTIIQKNNSLVIYPGSISDFKDPIKIDSLSQTDGTIDSLYAWITQTDSTSADTNYYTEYDMIVEYSAIDPGGLIGKDTVEFFIDALNDPPVWAGLNDTIVKENDSLYIDFANYLTDVDDSTLTLTILPLTYDSNVTVEPSKTFEKKAEGYVYSSKARKDLVKIKPDALWFKPDSGPWKDASITKNPIDTLTNQIKFKITAADDDTSTVDTFVVKVQRVPRPEIRMYVVQNNAFTNYYEVFLVDSVGKTRDLTLNVQSKAVTLDTAAAFTYVGHYNFQTKGNYTFEVASEGVVGDTVITEQVGLTLAKMYGNWAGASADGQFHVLGKNGSVDFDQTIMILDSTLFEPHFNDRASYLLGNEALKFNKLVEVSMPGEDEEVAVYRRSLGSGWVELPSYTEGNRVNAYTDKMGYFRIGPKTLTVPGQTSLQQNYPNPFNPSTTIEYDLGFVDGPYQRVNVTIYDIMGRNIKVLVNDEKSIGRYNVRWNGKDQNDVQVSSGVYFVHLTTDMGRSQTKKIMLMR